MATTTLSQTHNPYKSWLNITTDRRPLNPYQLLGLENLETNKQRIQAFAIRQRTALEMRRDSAEPAVWERVSQELDEAIAALSDPEQKMVIDATLRRQMASGGFVANDHHHAPLEVVSDESRHVARAETAGGVQCRHCGKGNLADRKFCAECGQPMWEACPNCQTLCPGGERFCGACGIEIGQFLSQRSRELQDKIVLARQLQADHQFDPALATLREVAKLDDRRFDSEAQQAAHLIDEFVADRRRQEGAASVALETAQTLATAQHYDRAIAALEKIPLRLRSKTVTALLESAKHQWQEIVALNRDIRAAVDAQRFLEALAKIERLLSLKPDHEQALQLGLQLGSRLVQTAKKLLKEQRFDEALKLLRQVPAFASNEDHQLLLDHASELSWLWNEIQTAPLANKPLLSLAERLVKSAPENAAAKQLLDQLRQQAATGKSAAPWLVGPLRAASARTKRAGLPVEWLGGFRSLPLADGVDAKLLANNPGRFFVACGLALQGLGQAAIDINLVPVEKKKSLLSGISFSFRKQGETTAWGLDLGSSALKAVKMVLDEKGDGVRIAAVELIEYPLTSDIADADLEGSTPAEAALIAFLSKHALQKNDRVCANLPGLRVLGRFFVTPPVDPKKLDAMIAFEAKKQIPYPLEELVWDYVCTDKVDEKNKEPVARRVVMLACKQNHVQSRLAIFERAKIKVDILQNDCVAIHNFLERDQHLAVAASEGSSSGKHSHTAAKLLLDVGGDATNIIISGPGQLWFRTIGLGGIDFTKPLLKSFGLTHAQAEQWKREPARAKRLYQMYAACDPMFAQFVTEIQRSLASFQTSDPNTPVDRLYGSGGGFQMHGLLGHLQRAF